MPDKYWLHCEEYSEAVGELLIDFDNDNFSFEMNNNYTGPLPFFLTDSDAPMPVDEQIKLWVTERAPEPNYTFIDALIEKAGLSEYDAYGFFKYNSGKFITDKFYVRKLL